MRILLLSGNEKDFAGLFREAKSRFREELALKYASASSGAVELLKEKVFDLFIIDLDLPGLENSETLSDLTTSATGMPVLFTGSRRFSFEEALPFEEDSYLVKQDLSPALIECYIRHALKLKEMERKLKEKEEQIALTVQHSPVLILKQDRDLRYTWTNNSFLGFHSEEVIGKTDKDLLPAEDALVLTAIKRQVLESAIKTRKIIRINAKDRAYYYDIGIEPDFDRQGLMKGIVSTALDITDKKSVEREFLRAKSLLENMFSSLNEAVFVSERSSGKIITCNPVVEKIFGYKPGEVTGKNPGFLFPSPEIYESMRAMENSLLGKKNLFRAECMMKRKDGTIIETENTINLLRKSKGWDEVLVTIVSDITERKRAERALIGAKERAENSDRLKTEFLAQMSHEIRTPVNTILTYSALLKEELDLREDDELRKNFKIIEKAGKRIFRTIDLILNMSELQTGNYELFPRELDVLDDILMDLYIEFKKYASGKGIEMQLEYSTTATKVMADEYSLSQVFRSIIDNAVKYTDRGSIKILVKKDTSGRLVVSVEDTGVGISESYLPRLFEAFSQEDQSYTRSYQGNGLGLALAKKYAELNKASIEVKSRKGSGSVFSVVFNN
ncbi:MAG: PAS domain S-box protein [Ignavibacteria bacterium]|jgi:PAS domain S-box-containing protein|nr:PAS domain S-box protein [Ignavibacteria bacterium]MCU7504450.1 PAS domain S-box protein [Ignavibacteria bacterium]MCU7517459.1 PAS domain S-box protein [Ignavibacteria bacterium]